MCRKSCRCLPFRACIFEIVRRFWGRRGWRLGIPSLFLGTISVAGFFLTVRLFGGRRGRRLGITPAFSWWSYVAGIVIVLGFGCPGGWRLGVRWPQLVCQAAVVCLVFVSVGFLVFFWLDGSRSSCCFYGSVGRKCCGAELFVFRCVVRARVPFSGGFASLFGVSRICCLISCSFCSSHLTRVSHSSLSCSCVLVFCSVASCMGCQAHPLGWRCVVLSGSTVHNSLHCHHGWIDTHVVLTRPHHYHHSRFSTWAPQSLRAPFSVFTPAVAMSDGGRAGASSAAMRRRDRRLTAAWRHEQLSVRMALAAAKHHSAPKCAGSETHKAPRGPTTGRATGKRPAPLAELSRPQEAAVTVGYVAAAWRVLLVSRVGTASTVALSATFSKRTWR